MQTSIFSEDKNIIYDLQFYFPEKENSIIKQDKSNILKKHNGVLKYVNSQPHISLASFVVASSRSLEIIDKLKEVLNQLTAIEVNFNNYICFDSNHLIYAKIEPENKFKPILNALDLFKKENKFANKHFTICDNIHATIVIPKEKSIYELLLAEYKSKILHSVFFLEKIMIRKTLSLGENYEFEMIILKH
jgi:hypothetical protein